MSLWLTGGVALGYATAVVALHRGNVWRLRRQAGGFEPLWRKDWDTLLAGVGDGGTQVRAELLDALRAGASVQAQAIEAAGFAGAEARWLALLGQVSGQASQVLDLLEATPPTSAAEAYLREHLALERRVNALSLEVVVFASKRRLGLALERFGEQPALFAARALASSLVGFSGAVIDDLARAVYFSREAPFYVQLVADLPFIEEARPSLWAACQQRLSASSE